MFITLILFLPFAACMFWAFLNFFIARRTSTFAVFTTLLLVLGVYLVTDACYAAPDTSYTILVFTSIFAQLTAPSIIPLVWLYLHRLKYGQKFQPISFVWVLLPVALTTAAMLLTQLAGVPAIASFLEALYSDGTEAAEMYRGDVIHIYYTWTAVFFRIVLGGELLVGVIAMIFFIRKEKFSFNILRDFFLKGGKCRVLELQMYNLIIPAVIVLLKIGLVNSFLDQHMWISVVLSIVMTLSLFNFAFTALFAGREFITRENMRHVMVYNFNENIKSVIAEFTLDDLLVDTDQDGLIRLRDKIGEYVHVEEEEPYNPSVSVTEQLFAITSNNWDDDSLLSRFQHLMMHDQLFLQPGLSLADIAERLHTNKTYVSKLVNNTYNLGFPELLNTLRIDYAEQYIMSHRDARQEEIAQACGFLSASSFNSIFKKVTGVTPKVWIAGIDSKRAVSAR